ELAADGRPVSRRHLLADEARQRVEEWREIRAAGHPAGGHLVAGGRNSPSTQPFVTRRRLGIVRLRLQRLGGRLTGNNGDGEWPPLLQHVRELSPTKEAHRGQARVVR